LSDHDPRALLVEALALFNDHPRFSLRSDRRRTSYALASRIEDYLGQESLDHPALSLARERWAMTGCVRVDDHESLVEPSSTGYWVRAWVHVTITGAADMDPAVADRYRRALAALPGGERAVLVALQHEGQSIQAIAGRHGITTREAERRLGNALAAIAHALGQG
jgi:DNA-directed RNA polymerase specialized sigma24 family protein